MRLPDTPRRPPPLTMRLAAVVLAGAAAALLLLVSVRWAAGPSFSGPVSDGTWIARSRAWFEPRGFYPPEFDPGRGVNFSWTQARAELFVPRIDRSVPHRVTFQLRAGRPQSFTLPTVVVAVDGVTRAQAQATNDLQDVNVEVPASSSANATITVYVSDTFQPGPEDKRSLGVVVERVSIAPLAGPFTLLGGILVGMALATMAYVLAAQLCGVGPAGALALGGFVAAAQAWLLLFDGAFMGTYVGTLERVALGVLALSCVVWVVRRLTRAEAAPEWPTAAAILLATLGIKLAFFLHPAATIGDSVMHVHRAMVVHSGSYFFTSITPRPFFEFPYAPALYVVAMPFWDLVTTEAFRIDLLRGIALAADGLVGLGLYFAVRGAWGSRRTALLVTVLWPFVRVSVQTLCTSNLTNAFGQGIFGLGMAVCVWNIVRERSAVKSAAVVTVLITVGFLSHFSTISVGVPLVGACAAALLAWGRGTTRTGGKWLAASLAVSVLLSCGIYYLNPMFLKVYRTTWERVMKREGEAETRSMVAPLPIKARRIATESAVSFGTPLLLAAGVGAVLLVRSRRRDGLTLVLAGWTLSTIAFLLLGVVTAVEMRANLAAAPAVVCLGALALGTLAERSRIGAAAACAVAALIVWGGLGDWMSCLGG
jgi:hypothetical protein